MRQVAFILALLTLGQASAANLTVFAAASLTDAFTELGQAFDAKTGNKTIFQFAGSQALRTQLENGAKADVYASANAAQYTPLVDKGLVTPGQAFVSNKLTVIAPRNNPRVARLPDLAAPGVKLVIADRNVPVGDYTRRMLAAIDRSGTYGKDFSAHVLKNVVSEEPNVRQVALKVQLGEADAAVVYVTDVTPALRPSVRVIALPTRFNQSATYPIGVLKGSANPQAAQAFVQYVLSPEGQQILKKWGFQAPR
ncbi:molybdate ABC transporter substrate-binding protein (plasmid) [Deinococcus metallilatus]|uniref:Molybdate transport system substrate-binding protein n=1 Tax=Deinococcus metallilatus TaxID=1211322 RepID=A0ABR6MV21_9DEIO|nr:molybdate ABC transporter substrate-binding protein [Deinococcus metallilatus]MBB5295783.1 molybdate transport system substrate-binding protein [Deinococcus metallilatus]QBY06782.1 molybdate ABC transporter substrate-binding protein [Deinococcus metallilatus]GMA14312.1 molybdate ABC transporter substrate-binding protein [Deinococcus metallilatus]